MTIGSKEHGEMMDSFEANAKDLFYGHIVKRESRDNIKKLHVFYTDGFVDTAFKIYSCGYSAGRCAYIN